MSFACEYPFAAHKERTIRLDAAALARNGRGVAIRALHGYGKPLQEVDLRDLRP